MDFVWSPWRMEYIRREDPPDGCIFCDAPQHEDSVENLIVHRGKHAYVILNRYPYTSGHVMVIPFDHISTMDALPEETVSEMMSLTRTAMRVIAEIYNPEGFNFGANLGVVAGAGIANHIHFHIVPRWGGDTNFMTAISATRVLPEELGETYARISAAWPAAS
jgi:ATP adenylyltransferase